MSLPILSLGDSWIVQRISDGKAVEVSRRDGLFPGELTRLEKKVKSGMATPEELSQTRDLAWDFAKRLLSHPPVESFYVESLHDFQYPESIYDNVGYNRTLG